MITKKVPSTFKCELKDLKHLKFELEKDKYIAVLIDPKGYEILKGYGYTKVEALNDLHNNLI